MALIQAMSVTVTLRTLQRHRHGYTPFADDDMPTFERVDNAPRGNVSGGCRCQDRVAFHFDTLINHISMNTTAIINSDTTRTDD